MKTQIAPSASLTAVLLVLSQLGPVAPAHAQANPKSPVAPTEAMEASGATTEASALPAEAEASADGAATETTAPVAPLDTAPAEAAQPAAPETEPSLPAPTLTPTMAVRETAVRKVAVLDLRSSEENAPLASALAAVLTSELGRRDGIQAISRNELRALLEQQATSALLGCESEKCAADLAGVIDADGIVTGAVDFIDGALIVSLAMIDPEGTTPTRRLEWTWRGSAAELVTIANPAVHRLLLGAAADSLKGSLRVGAPDGAEIVVDGESVAAAPLEDALTDLSIGVHEVVVRQDGFAEKHTSVAVSPSETSIVDVTLDPLPFYTQGWFWGTVAAATGGVVITAASVTAFVIASSLPLPAKVIDVSAGAPAATRGLTAPEGGQR